MLSKFIWPSASHLICLYIIICKFDQRNLCGHVVADNETLKVGLGIEQIRCTKQWAINSYNTGTWELCIKIRKITEFTPQE